MAGKSGLRCSTGRTHTAGSGCFLYVAKPCIILCRSLDGCVRWQSRRHSRLCRWVFCLAPNAESRLNLLYECWAKQLLGGQVWRNSAVARNELGWFLSGYDLVILAVAKRRAKLWQLPVGDIYGDAFRMGNANQFELSWAAASAKCLCSAGVPDWPSRPCDVTTLAAYAKLVRSILVKRGASSWERTVASHSSVVPYNVFQPVRSNHLASMRCLDLTWQLQLCSLSWSRFRAGYIALTGTGASTSRAKYQSCRFCDMTVRNWIVHCLADCPRWSHERAVFCSAAGLDVDLKGVFAKHVLTCLPGARGFHEVLLWFRTVDLEWQKT